ncbi:putative tryptophanyl-tRNA synthetase II [Lactobacillus jensenii 1153]|nr:putative tryptophanyl-tRNA synthetase II [Lactobacillus jensenii 1153]
MNISFVQEKIARYVKIKVIILKFRKFEFKEITMAKEVLLTGDRPTGRLHIGHYIGSLKIG